MRVLGLGLIAFYFTISTVAFAAPEISVSKTKPVELERPLFPSWRISEAWKLSAVHSEEKELMSESVRADIEGSLELSKTFDDQFTILLRPAFRFVNGRDQDIFSDRLPKDKIYADEAKVTWSPAKESLVEAGSINQSHLENGLLVDERPFPAGRAQLGLQPTDSTLMRLAAQFAVPTSYTLEDKATGNEPLPKLQTYSAMLEQLVTQTSSIEVGATYFTFQDLPQIVAVDSLRLGNSVDLFSSSTGRFRYDYQGVALQAQANLALGAWDFIWRGEGIRNTSAPSSLGTGYVSTIEAKRAMSEAREGGLSLSYYRVQPDTAPALYTDPIYSNNRIGAGASAFVNHLRWGLQFKASYYQDTPYYQNDLMGDRNLFLISVGNLTDDSTSKR